MPDVPPGGDLRATGPTAVGPTGSAGWAGLPAAAAVVGLGVDLCDVERMRQALDRTPSLRRRLFTQAEREYCDRRRDPAERYAVRFAAKEAVLKAMGVGLGACALRDIEVVRASSGAPSLALHASAAGVAAERGIVAWQLSLTHTETVAQATALALG
jgi:phosphopantetheine--protein transferase-like protein